MDIQKALTYCTEDEGWIVKLIIGAVLVLFSWLIIPAFILMGYGLAITRNVMNDDPEPLPEWSDWGSMLSQGFILTMAYITYLSPFILLICCASFLLIGASSAGSGDMAEALAGLGMATIFGLTCVFMIFMLAFIFIAPAITLLYVKEESFAACFAFGKIMSITRDNLGDIVMVLVVTFGLSFVLSFIGLIPIIGWIIAIAANVYLLFVIYHLYGQIGAKINNLSAWE